MKRVLGVFMVIALALFLPAEVLAQTSPWGGKGEVSVSPSQVARGSGTEIVYRVTGSRGTGTAGFKCEVTNPSGTIHQAGKASTKWTDGRAEARFSYPADFSGSKIPCSANQTGTYQIQCFWYISGYGVDGKTAAAGGAFVVN